MMTFDEFRAALTGNEIDQGKPMVAKFNGECGWCGQAVLPGDNVLYLFHDKAVLCQSCAIIGEP